MPDPTATITRLISTGKPEAVLLAARAHLVQDLTLAELSQALQVAQHDAERRALRAH